MPPFAQSSYIFCLLFFPEKEGDFPDYISEINNTFPDQLVLQTMLLILKETMKIKNCAALMLMPYT